MTPEQMAAALEVLFTTYDIGPHAQDAIIAAIAAARAQERAQDQCFVTLCDRLTEDHLWHLIETGLGHACRARAATIRALD